MSNIVISSPVTGKVVDLKEVPDEVFAEKMMGDGIAIIPEEDTVYAPENGEVILVFETKHAIGYRTASGVALLIHVGVDTVNLKGEGFTSYVKVGQKLKKGDRMLKIDREYIEKNAKSIITPIICTELMDYQRVKMLGQGNVKAGEAIFEVEENYESV